MNIRLFKRGLIITMILLMVTSPATASRLGPNRDFKTPGSIMSFSNSLQTVYLPIAVRLQRAGERLDIYNSGPQTFPANQPFHIAHGWLLDVTGEQSELFDFQLQVDGIYRDEDFIEVKIQESRVYVYNFSDGMSGVHTFIGHWLAPCWALFEDCADPNEIIENRTSTVEVTFIP